MIIIDIQSNKIKENQVKETRIPWQDLSKSIILDGRKGYNMTTIIKSM
jgi:hypothetical protein